MENEIYAVDESGATDSWQWVISLSRNDNSSYRLLVYTVLWESTEEDAGTCYELPSISTGAELYEFVQSSWRNDHDQGLDEQAWREIELNIRSFDDRLADQVQQAARAAFDGAEPVTSDEQQQIDRCIEGATWARNEYAGGGAMWAAVADNKRMTEAVAAFVRAHHAQHGETPQRTHLVLDKEVTFPTPASNT